MKVAEFSASGLPPVRTCLIAETRRERMRGLLGRPGLERGTVMAFPGCSLLHTIGMRFALDIAFLDKTNKVVRTMKNVRPGRLFVWGGFRARTAVEAEAGWLLRE